MFSRCEEPRSRCKWFAYRLLGLDRVNVHLCTRVRKVGVEIETVGLVNIPPERVLPEHSLLPTSKTLQRTLQFSYLCNNINGASD